MVRRQASPGVSCDRADRADDAGVVDHDVEPAEARHGQIDGGGDVRLRRHVGADEGGAIAELGRQPGARAFLHVAQDQFGPVFMKQPRRARADAAGRAGDDRDPILEPVAHVVLLPWTCVL